MLASIAFTTITLIFMWKFGNFIFHVFHSLYPSTSKLCLNNRQLNTQKQKHTHTHRLVLFLFFKVWKIIRKFWYSVEIYMQTSKIFEAIWKVVSVILLPLSAMSYNDDYFIEDTLENFLRENWKLVKHSNFTNDT